MAKEHNAEHLSINQPVTDDQLLDAAGRLCVVQLLAGVSGYASMQLLPDEEYISPNRCGYNDIELLRHALATKLFSVDNAGVARPVPPPLSGVCWRTSSGKSDRRRASCEACDRANDRV